MAKGQPALTENELARLTQREKTYWRLTIVLLVILSLTIIVQYLTSYNIIPSALDSDTHYRTTLSVGLPGLVILFCLYTTAKRREIRFLKSTLFSQQHILRKLADRTRELEEALDELKKVGGLKDMLISTVSHELQTPLASIYTISQALLSYENTDVGTTRKFYRLISEESKRLSDLVRNLLDLAKIESGTMSWEFRKCDVSALVESALAPTEILAGQRKIEIVREVEPDLPPVRADRDRVIQVLTNLIGNGIKFTPDGGRVTLKAGLASNRGPQGQEMVEFEICDTGVGIPPDQRERVFERFHRAATPMGTRSKGTGLGLAISRDIVVHQGGEIWVESQQGVGSSFFFTVAVAADDDGTCEDSPTQPEAPAEIPAPASSPKQTTSV